MKTVLYIPKHKDLLIPLWASHLKKEVVDKLKVLECVDRWTILKKEGWTIEKYQLVKIHTLNKKANKTREIENIACIVAMNDALKNNP